MSKICWSDLCGSICGLFHWSICLSLYHTILSWFSSVQFSHSVVSDSLQPHELQHARPLCLSPTPGVHLNPCPLSQWCHPTISSSVIPFSSCLQSFPASESFPMSQFFASGGQSWASASASILPMKIQDWFPLQLTGGESLSLNYSQILPFQFALLTFLCIQLRNWRDPSCSWGCPLKERQRY